MQNVDATWRDQKKWDENYEGKMCKYKHQCKLEKIIQSMLILVWLVKSDSLMHSCRVPVDSGYFQTLGSEGKFALPTVVNNLNNSLKDQIK